MEQITGLVLMLLLCFAGWQLGEMLKLPAAAILGAMIVIGVGSALAVPLYLPAMLRSVSSVGIGMTIGFRFNLKLKRSMLLPLLVFLAFIFLVSLGLGFILMAFGLDRYTALFAGMLGGITEIAVIALDFEAVTYQVSLFHTVRMVTLMLVIPYLARRLPAPQLERGDGDGAKAGATPPTARDWGILIIGAALTAALGGYLAIPAGKMLGAMAFTAFYVRRRKIEPKMNRKLQGFLQSLVGGAVGLGMTPEGLAGIPELIVPLVVLDVLVFGECILHAWIMHKVAKWDKLTSILACTPGGLGPCVLLSAEMGADSTTVTMYQVIRYLAVIMFAAGIGMLLRV